VNISSAIPGKISLQSLYHLSGGDEQFVKQMLISFTETTEKGMSDIREAMMSGKVEMIADLAHKMLPPCRHVGASDLCDYLKKIEVCIHNKSDGNLLEKLIKESFGEFEIIRELIKELTSKIS
jgi:HPt (histidine-containing phosphotransfer) domain-containing protein